MFGAAVYPGCDAAVYSDLEYETQSSNKAFLDNNNCDLHLEYFTESNEIVMILPDINCLICLEKFKVFNLI